MADALDTLKGLLGSDAEDKIKSVMDSLSGTDALPALSSANDNGYVDEIRSLIQRLGTSRSDPRANLLMSLRPYMRESRQRSIDTAVKLLNISKLSGLFREG